MIDLFSGLGFWVSLGLVLAFGFVLTFEFINGFHDTANAVATVIYTRAIPPRRAVALSGLFNFLGVACGGVGVAYAIVHLLPIDLLLNVNTAHGLVMVFSLLAAAILWNFGTWYFGIPASSSHTLIGAILGVGLANAALAGLPLADGVNWKKATDIILSLVISPAVGFICSALLLVLLLRLWPMAKMHKTPEARRELDGKKHPPFWSRLVLVLSALGVSYAHGSNDGQKGIGLIMLVLIGIVPGKFVLDMNSSPYQIQHTREAAVQLHALFQRDHAVVGKLIAPVPGHMAAAGAAFTCSPNQAEQTIAALGAELNGVDEYSDLKPESRISVRRYLLCLDDVAKKVGKLAGLPGRDKADLERMRKDLTTTTEYVPLWVTLAVALALGCGTMVGWKRVVQTIGEKIGRQGMTYAQGMAAQAVTGVAIAAANLYSLPVSTTHVLSSGVAGTMVANRSGLQRSTVRNILIAWVLTLPASMVLAASLFWGASKLFG